jgi:hypothetical protein
MALLLPWSAPYRTHADALRQHATGETPHRVAFDPLEQGVKVAWGHRPRENVRTHRQCSSGFQRHACAVSSAFNASGDHGPRLAAKILQRLQIEELTTQLLGSARNWSPSICDFFHGEEQASRIGGPLTCDARRSRGDQSPYTRPSGRGVRGRCRQLRGAAVESYRAPSQVSTTATVRSKTARSKRSEQCCR